MSGPSSGANSPTLELLLVVTAGVGSLLFVLGLGYRFWRWVTTPEEKTARKQEVLRERLKRTVRRPAQEIPIDESLLRPMERSDPALNDEVLE